MYFIVIEIENMIKYNYRYILGVVEGVSGSPVVLHHSPGALATTRLPLDTQQHLFLITIHHDDDDVVDGDIGDNGDDVFRNSPI